MGVADRVRVSRRLSYVLRHAPESIGLALGERGWVRVDELLAAAGATFTVSDNGVWLVDAVPAKYLSVAGATG